MKMMMMRATAAAVLVCARRGLAMRSRVVKQAQRGPATWKVEDIKDHLKKKSLDASSMSIAQAKPGICILGRPVGPLAMNQYMVFCEVSKNSSSFVCLLGWLFVCFERGMNMHLLSLSLFHVGQPPIVPLLLLLLLLLQGYKGGCHCGFWNRNYA